MKYKKTVLVTLILSLTTFAHAKKTDEKKSVNQKVNNNVELLFIQQADEGSIKSIKGNADCYKLTLNQFNHKILYFSNTPERISGHLSNHALLTTLNHNINVENIKPNGVLNALVMTDKKFAEEISIAGTISNAAFNKKIFFYRFCPFGQQAQMKEAKLRAVSLFVDPIHRWPP